MQHLYCLSDPDRVHACSQGELSFRQSPTFQDCFPGSKKCYTEVEHNGQTLKVSARYQQHVASVAAENVISMEACRCARGSAQVPFRRVTLTEDNGHFDLYDTSGPQVRSSVLGEPSSAG